MTNKNNIENVVLISLDCVRGEALSCYPRQFPWRTRVFQEAHTPNIDRLFKDGHRFDQAITHAPFTPAAHASLLTGLIPPKHNVRKFLGSKISDGVVTIAEKLSASGWKCGAVVAAFSLNREFGFARGFDHYADSDVGRDAGRNWKEKAHRDAAQITDQAVGWLDSVEEDQPFFLFVHYFDAHNEPTPGPRPTHTQFTQQSAGLRASLRDGLPAPVYSVLQPIDQAVRSLYYKSKGVGQSITASVLGFFEAGRVFSGKGRRYMLRQTSAIDVQLGRITQALADREALENTLIILVADHGDDFCEHGEPTHRQFLYDTTLLVPLIIYPRLGEEKIIREQVGLVNIFPTVLSALGLESESGLDGESLISLVGDPKQPDRELKSRTTYSETLFEVTEIKDDKSDAVRADATTCFASLRSFPWKLIWDRLNNSYELYNLADDPNEKNNVFSAHPQIVGSLSTELSQLAQEMPVVVDEVDREVVERLEALGYL